MVAVTDTSPDAAPAPAAVDGDAAAPVRNIGAVPTASLLTGAAIATVWFWIPLTIFIIGISSIPSGIGFALSVVVFVYLMRGVEHVERLRSEAVFGLGIGVPPRRISPSTGIQRWLHQLWLDISSARFWKATAHHYLRMAYDMLAAGIALTLLVFAFLGPPPRSQSGRVTTPGCLSCHRRWPGCWRALRWSRRWRSWSSPLPSTPSLTAGCCRRRRRLRCSTRSGRLPMPVRARCRRRRPSVTASNGICTTACSRDWCRWP